MSDLAPVAEGRRIKTLDVMRGLAVLGILPVNAPFFAAPWQTTQNPLLPPLAIDAANAWSWFVPHVFFEAKFITLFSMLFGASVFLVGGGGSDKERGAVLTRRLMWLLLFGLLHGALIWFGDVLLLYAVAGFILMFMRSWPPRVLITLGAGLYLVTTALRIHVGLLTGAADPSTLGPVREFVWAPPASEVAEWRDGFRSSAFGSTYTNFLMWTGFIYYAIKSALPHTLGVMMIGMGLFKTGFFSGAAPKWVYWVFAAIGAAALAAIGWQAVLNYQSGFEFVFMQARGSLVNPALAIFVSLLYASLLILTVKANALRFLTNALAPVGRMAFTNYVAQSLIMTAIFYGGRGFGLWGEVGRDGLMMIVGAVWAAQLIWSPLWLSRFNMGPLEWLWRRASYAKPVAFAKTAAT